MPQIAEGRSQFTESVIHFAVTNDNSRHPDRGGQRALSQIREATGVTRLPAFHFVQ